LSASRGGADAVHRYTLRYPLFLLVLARGVLLKEEKEEKEKDYYVSERRYGSFHRYFQLPEGVDTDKIEASFKKGVLTVTLPKKPEARKPEKKIQVKAAA
jgi:HSP20 family molecular chaperone IbpA